jgi:hypothetical protein
MKGANATRVFLVVLPLCFYCVDVGFTLLGQSPLFWAGEHSLAREANPLARALLQIGPWAFVAAAAFWACCFSLILVLWRHSWAWVMAFVLTFFHAIGAATWLMPGGWLGAIGAVALILLAQRCWSMMVMQVTKSQDDSVT